MKILSALLLAGTLTIAACAQTGPAQSEPVAAKQGMVALSGDGELVETERAPTNSPMQIRRAPAGSVPSAMYALRGARAVLKARGATKSVFTVGDRESLQF